MPLIAVLPPNTRPRGQRTRRPNTPDYIETAFDEFSELHGDRLYSDDRAVVSGFAKLGEERVMVMGTQKGRDTKENVLRNFGCAHPEGYRKALRLMKLANKFALPIITIIDTAGAFPGIGAEERHIAEAIAVNLKEMMTLEVPIIAVVIGEGGSGGALGIGVADRVLILENAYYSVISPEGCAAILWRTAERRGEAAAALKLTSNDLLELGVADEVVPEPAGGAHSDWDAASEALREVLGAPAEVHPPGPPAAEQVHEEVQRHEDLALVLVAVHRDHPGPEELRERPEPQVRHRRDVAAVLVELRPQVAHAAGTELEERAGEQELEPRVVVAHVRRREDDAPARADHADQLGQTESGDRLGRRLQLREQCGGCARRELAPVRVEPSASVQRTVM